jgi:hypothetical protein
MNVHITTDFCDVTFINLTENVVKYIHVRLLRFNLNNSI